MKEQKKKRRKEGDKTSIDIIKRNESEAENEIEEKETNLSLYTKKREREIWDSERETERGGLKSERWA
jgi:hypothetical protein